MLKTPKNKKPLSDAEKKVRNQGLIFFFLFFALMEIGGVLESVTLILISFVLWGVGIYLLCSKLRIVRAKQSQTALDGLSKTSGKKEAASTRPSHKVCPSCRSAYSLDALYCDECGTRLVEKT